MGNLVSFVLYLFTNDRVKDVAESYAKFAYGCRSAAECGAEFLGSLAVLVDDFERSKADGESGSAGSGVDGGGVAAPEAAGFPGGDR
jgi:hypothetical protein